MKDLIYILSPSYSGSTLLTYLLAQHPAVATIGELKGTAMGDIDTYDCSCGSRLLDCEFWCRLCEAADNAGVPFSFENYETHFTSEHNLTKRLLQSTVRGKLFELLRRLLITAHGTSSSQLEKLLDHNQSLMKLIVDAQDASFFVDGSKDPVRLMLFQRSRRFNIKVIQIVRDGRGVANSFVKNEKLAMPVASDVWRRAAQEVARVFERTPADDRMQVCYEELCENVEGVMSQVWSFLGTESIAQKQSLDLRKNHIIGNRMRLQGEVKIRLDERWKERFSDTDCADFDRVAGRMNNSLGYSRKSGA